jgi:sucrose phosphorylase
MNDDLAQHLINLFGSEHAPALSARLEKIISDFQERHPDLADYTGSRVSEKDAILITYGDMVKGEGSPLETLAHFLEKHLAGLINSVHFLPFFPFSSDDGFSVIDYWQVDPALGSWPDVALTGRSFRLMFDAVINHISAESEWFQGYLEGDPTYEDYFITAEPTPALSQVFRPRTHPLLTRFDTADGPKYVWTTFSEDQIDLNFSNPDVLIKIIELLLFYVAQGAEFIRLDAIGFMWKEIGTNCIHLSQTHRAIQLMRSILDLTAPRVS